MRFVVLTYAGLLPAHYQVGVMLCHAAAGLDSNLSTQTLHCSSSQNTRLQAELIC